MSSEGVTLIWRAVLVAVLIIVTAFVRVQVGPSKRRGFYMRIGTVGGGISAGVAVASLRHESEILERLIQKGKVLVVGAEYSLETGVVDFFDNAPEPGEMASSRTGSPTNWTTP